MRAEKKRLTWVPNEPTSQQKEREHMRADKAEDGAGPRQAWIKSKRKSTREQRKKRAMWVPNEPGSHQKERKHMRAEKAEGGVGPN